MRYFIGVDLGGTNVRSLLVDEKGNILTEKKKKLKVLRVLIMFFKKLLNKLKDWIIVQLMVLKMLKELELGFQGLLIQLINGW